MVAAIRRQFSKRLDAWLSRRAPRSKQVLLDQKRVFIFPTRYGFFFGMMAFAIFLGGVNYSNSLLLGLSFFLASIFVVTILHTFRNLSGLQITAGKTENAFAGEQARFQLQLGREGDRTYDNIQFQWPGSSEEAISLVDRSEGLLDIYIPTEKRGRLVPGRLKVETRYPLGIIRSWSWVSLDMDCLVYPKPIKNEFVPEGYLVSDEGESILPNGVEDFYGLRPYIKGDSLKHVDWKTLAKGNDLYSKQFVDYADSSTWLDFKSLPVADPELKLSYLTYWVTVLSEQRILFGLKLPGQTIDVGEGPQHLQQCLEAMALYDPQ